MHGDYHIWQDQESKLWNICKEVWIGGDGGTKYYGVASGFSTRESAIAWLNNRNTTKK